MENAFLQLDNDILGVAQSPKYRYHHSFVAPAIAGAVPLLTCLFRGPDSKKSHLFVANAGDVRAVLGTKDGKWKAKPLSNDMNADNPIEYSRVLSEHPASEANTAIMNGRVVGHLQPVGIECYDYVDNQYER